MKTAYAGKWLGYVKLQDETEADAQNRLRMWGKALIIGGPWFGLLVGGLLAAFLVGLHTVPGSWNKTTWDWGSYGGYRHYHYKYSIGHMGILGYALLPIVPIAFFAIPLLCYKQYTEAKLRHKNMENISLAAVLGLVLGAGIAFALCCVLPHAQDTHTSKQYSVSRTTTVLTSFGVDLFIYCVISTAVAAMLIAACYQQYQQRSGVKKVFSLSNRYEHEYPVLNDSKSTASIVPEEQPLIAQNRLSAG